VRRVYYIPVRHKFEMNWAQMGMRLISVPPNCPVCLCGVSVNNRMDSYLVPEVSLCMSRRK
jgi:predicted transporter